MGERCAKAKNEDNVSEQKKAWTSGEVTEVVGSETVLCGLSPPCRMRHGKSAAKNNMLTGQLRGMT